MPPYRVEPGPLLGARGGVVSTVIQKSPRPESNHPKLTPKPTPPEPPRRLRRSRINGCPEQSWFFSAPLILRNPFHIGLIRFRNRKETFAGAHPLLVASTIFNHVQFVIDGKQTHIRHKHRFLFTGLIKCETCRLCFTAERQKGHNTVREFGELVNRDALGVTSAKTLPHQRR